MGKFPHRCRRARWLRVLRNNSAMCSAPGVRKSPACGASPRNNGITEGFHTKIKILQTYGFRKFQDYRLRLKVLCFEISRSGGCPQLSALSPCVEPVIKQRIARQGQGKSGGSRLAQILDQAEDSLARPLDS